MACSVIKGISGPVVTAGGSGFFMMEMVYVGRSRLIGEVIGLSGGVSTIQVYEETEGLSLGEPVEGTGAPMSIMLGPGIMNNIFDGIERPLSELEKIDGAFISRGSKVSLLPEDKKWETKVIPQVGDYLYGGDIIAEVHETDSVTHRSLVPPDVSGEVIRTAPDGYYTITEPVVTLRTPSGEEKELFLAHRWPIRTPRPVKERLPMTVPLITGQRIIDTLFPVAKGGTAAVPGGFGTGKTMTQHQLAKWCDADIIIYVGCGERGNEMSQVLDEFSSLIDPRTNRPMTERTCLIANTSNMPVAAREASIYTGITLAEYYRDMGYHVAIMADSTSRWAEALREISGRLEEMPAEEGFPAYLPSRLSEFYERAGRTVSFGGKEGSVTIIGAVSPQGSDFSEPVTQNTKRFVRTFWALDKSLAYARHYPAINWILSYSEYGVDLEDWFDAHGGDRFLEYKRRVSHLLGEEDRLMEIVKLIGADVLPDDQKLILETSAVIRQGFLQQNAFHKDDTYVPLEKQRRMMEVILHLHDGAAKLISSAVPISQIKRLGLFEKLNRMKYDIPNDDLTKFDEYIREIDEALEKVR
ncbi:MAG: V-type ATP synthase subunit A [Ruminococcaceae bacterium]|nr:V-type ATP synthase subunit A [Oscillospiraceae bacterium]